MQRELQQLALINSCPVLTPARFQRVEMFKNEYEH